jgi:hypothetical protein
MPPNTLSTSILVVGLPLSPRDGGFSAHDAYGGYHKILEGLKEKVRVSDCCYVFDSDEGHPFISQVMDYCERFSRPGELQFPVFVAELADSPITTIRFPVEAKAWLQSRGVRCREGAI